MRAVNGCTRTRCARHRKTTSFPCTTGGLVDVEQMAPSSAWVPVGQSLVNTISDYGVTMGFGLRNCTVLGAKLRHAMFVSATTEVLADTAVLYELRLTWIGARPVQ